MDCIIIRLDLRLARTAMGHTSTLSVSATFSAYYKSNVILNVWIALLPQPRRLGFCFHSSEISAQMSETRMLSYQFIVKTQHWLKLNIVLEPYMLRLLNGPISRTGPNILEQFSPPPIYIY